MPLDAVPTQGAISPHIWRFFRVGGFDQVRIDSGSDVACLPDLDQKLWVALACPTRGLEFDEKTLDLIDTDQDGRIRAPELLTATIWATSLLKDPDDLTKGRSNLPLDAFNGATEEGTKLVASARTILKLLGKPDASEITLEDTTDIEAIFADSLFNGDGIVPVEAADSPEVAGLIGDIITLLGSENDRSGKPGISQVIADRFFAGVDAFAAWHGARGSQVLTPLGENSADAAVLVHVLAAKLDDYFTRCKLAEFDPSSEAGLNPDPALYAGFATVSLDDTAAAVAALPLARIEPGRPLPLTQGLNPAWAERIGQFREQIVVPVLGNLNQLSEGNWGKLKQQFAEWQAWVASEPETPVKQLGIARIDAIITAGAKSAVDALIAKDAALAPEIDAIGEVDKLLRLQRDLYPLLNNFVAFRDFYTRAGKAIFQAGTLYLDSRSLDLCVKVEDEAKHSQIAVLSGVYLVYCRCTRKGQTMTIAAAVTSGDSYSIRVGRNCLFYDRKGQDWDATITKVIEHPISLRQAFWLPYLQAGRAISEAVQKLATARQASVTPEAAQKAIDHAVSGGAAPPAPVPAVQAKQGEFDVAKFAGIFAAIGLALGALATAVATIVTGFLHLKAWQMPLVLLGLVLLVSGPSLIIAALKLAARNLGPILDASGWAVNTQLKINIPFGTALTALPKLPPGAQRSLADPYAEKRTPWALYLVLVLIVAGLAVVWHFRLWETSIKTK